MTFTDAVRELLDSPQTFARVSTILPDGAPQTTVIWFRRDGETLRMSCGRGSRKARNIRRDGRVSVVVERPGDPYNFVEVRGTAEVVEDITVGRDELRRLSHRYVGRERGDAWFDSLGNPDMVALVVHAERVIHTTDQEP